ncbi:threonine-phosphate decarboxylase CobD [Virgibacillus sp. YIM 98842]|uniref:threonine-phosphate decarboxylase CobD n=1 Tax=Virgibacillus sp. YIM 98842 TaxID=2663533 RepID=UPI0013D9DF73|nr:threonine-phosphate decarboxylase CobD [Virgibacillus sp. YIM 98842]
MKLPSHGSNPSYLYQAFEIPLPDKIIDFSVNLNPFGPPLKIKESWSAWLPLIEDYPDPHGTELIQLISETEGIDTENILLGNGAAELISLVLNYLAEKHIGIIQPAFSEYEKAARANRCHVTYIHLPKDNWSLDAETLSGKLDSLDALFFCNPNNPTGISYSSAILLDMLKVCEKHHCYLIIDEAFLDFLEDGQSLSHFITESNYLIILRSLTKMYAIAGLRLGFLMTNQKLLEKLQRMQPHWNVNALALEAGKAALKDKDYVYQTKLYVRKERERMIYELKHLGYQLSESKVNFYLLRDPSLHNQSPLIHYLMQKGIVPRHTENYPGLNGRWLRFAVRQQDDNNILLEALTAWKQES